MLSGQMYLGHQKGHQSADAVHGKNIGRIFLQSHGRAIVVLKGVKIELSLERILERMNCVKSILHHFVIRIIMQVNYLR